MSPITVDPATLEQLRNAQTTLEVIDSAGNVVGHFVPALSGPEPTISEEELQRREQCGGGRPLASILADLEKHP